MCSALRSFPVLMDAEHLLELISTLDRLKICAGQPDMNFVSMVRAKKGKVLSSDGTVVDNMPVDFGGNTYTNTVRTSSCEILSEAGKCTSCSKYRASLRSMCHRWNKRLSTQSSSVYTNDRYLNTPEKSAKIKVLKKECIVQSKLFVI